MSEAVQITRISADTDLALTYLDQLGQAFLTLSGLLESLPARIASPAFTDRLLSLETVPLSGRDLRVRVDPTAVGREVLAAVEAAVVSLRIIERAVARGDVEQLAVESLAAIAEYEALYPLDDGGLRGRSWRAAHEKLYGHLGPDYAGPWLK